MGWELRNGKRYYYRKIRRGRRVISEYVGASEFAELLLELDEFDRAEKTLSRIAWKKQKDEVKRLNKDIRQLAKIINGMARASLLISGYHPHKGQWRQKRNG
jgi:N-glycosylase/DNA lyase